MENGQPSPALAQSRKLQDRLEQVILASLPRILALLDKNPLSRTRGSFDRKYWHYKIMDFPCGMQQELVLPLAYVWRHQFAGNTFHQMARLREYILGAFDFHAVSCHPDGSLDDYFPWERAYGATAYALAALTEAVLITGLMPSARSLVALAKSGEFLASYREAGLLANHLAIAALALMNLHLLTGQAHWLENSRRLVDELAGLQHPEGWFQEYEGCDLGYQTVTLEFLARCQAKAPSEKLWGLLKDNLEFLRPFLHPDGSLGGEYGSRNTYNFYPGGFALLSTRLPQAAEMLGGFFQGLESGAENHLVDDGVFGHLLSSYITVLGCPEIEVTEIPPPPPASRPEISHSSGAGLFIGRNGGLTVYGSTTKGGVFKVFKDSRLVWSDTGLSGRLKGGPAFCQNKARCATALVQDDRLIIRGYLQRFHHQRLTPFKMTALRMLSLVLGRWRGYSNLIRRLMQKVLIYNQKPLKLAFTRILSLEPGRIRCEDELEVGPGLELEELYRSTDCVDTHVITSDAFQLANLLPWEPLAVIPGARRLSYTKIISE